jgi:hypothetical protein
MTIALDTLPAEDFEALVGQVLQAEAGATRFALEVERVERSEYAGTRPLPGFSVFLRSAPQAGPGQGMVRLHHPRHGALDLFMTILGRDANGGRYEILFN